MDSEALPQQPSTQRKQHDPSGQSRAIARPNLTPSRRKSGPDPLSASAIRRQEASYNKMLYLLTQDARQHQQRINALREGYAQLMWRRSANRCNHYSSQPAHHKLSKPAHPHPQQKYHRQHHHRQHHCWDMVKDKPFPRALKRAVIASTA
jgi:hypothetical protein